MYIQKNNDLIALIKQIVFESMELPDKSEFNPEMYYFIILYIIEHSFDFYSEDIFKYFLLKGYLYFQNQTLHSENKMYIIIFEDEVKKWQPKFDYEELDSILYELLNTEKVNIIQKLKNSKNIIENLKTNINTLALSINKKNKDNYITEDNYLEKLFNLF